MRWSRDGERFSHATDGPHWVRPASCSTSTATRSKTWMSAGRAWRTPTSRWSSSTRTGRRGRPRLRSGHDAEDQPAQGTRATTPPVARPAPRLDRVHRRASAAPRTRASTSSPPSLTVGYLFLRRNTEVEGTDLLLPSVALPSILGALIAFGVVIGPAYALAMEKEDGTLLRHKAVPHGLVGYFTGQLVFQSLSLVPQMVVILVPSFLLFDDLMADVRAGSPSSGCSLLGLLATLPIGMIIGALVPDTQKVGTWGMLPVMVLAGISGSSSRSSCCGAGCRSWPRSSRCTGSRSACARPSCPSGRGARDRRLLAHRGDRCRARRLGGGRAALTPVVLRRMARRQSGSQVEAAREAACSGCAEPAVASTADHRVAGCAPLRGRSRG